MGKIKYFFSVLCLFLLAGCTNNLTAEANKVYATDIYFNSSNITCFEDSTFNISNIELTILPAKATVKPIFSVDNDEIANFDSTKGTLSFNTVGTVNLIAEIEIAESIFKKAALQFNVETKPVYASSISFTHKNIELNFNETAVNLLEILPLSFNQTIEIQYSTNDVEFSNVGKIVNYNYETGKITPLCAGTEKVFVKAQISENNYITDYFTVVVTNYVYATDLEVNVNGKTSLQLLTESAGKLSYSTTPSNYNLDVEFLTTNNLIEINKLGEFVVGENSGSGEIIVKVKSGQNEHITKTIPFNITKPDKTIDFNLYANNESADYAFVNTSYKLIINNENINYNQVIINGCDYTHINGNEYEVSFNTTDETQISVSYVYESDINNITISGFKTINVYNCVSGINFGLTNNNEELIRTNNNYNLFLFNENEITEANENNVFNDGTLYFSAANMCTLPNAIACEFDGESVGFENGNFYALKEGISVVSLISSDPNNFSITFTITVAKVVPETINITNEIKTLYINENNEADSAILHYEIVPKYALYDKVIIEADNNCVSINNNVISAQFGGTAKITVRAGEALAQISVEVAHIPNKIIATINDEEIVNNVTLNVKMGDTFVITPKLYCNSVYVDKCVLVHMKGTVIQNENDSCVKFFNVIVKGYGSTTITFSYDNLHFVVNLICERINKITGAKFINVETSVNRYFLTSSEFNYVVTCEDNNYAPTEKLEIVVSDESVVIIESNTINYLGDGDVSISLQVDGTVLDYVTINVFYKEVILLNSVNDFLSVNNGNYLVTSNLDFTNFETPINLNGEIDFNNHIISNVPNYLFNSISQGSIVKNMVVSGISNCLTGFNSLIANSNHGTISNILFKDLFVNTVTNNEAYRISLICLNNFGNISNVKLSNVVITETREKVTNALSKVAGIVYENDGNINNVCGSVSINNFMCVAGVVNLNRNLIENVDLEINITANSKSSIGGAVWKSFANAKYNEINLTTTVTGASNFNFGGLINVINGKAEIERCYVNNYLALNASTSNIGLFIYSAVNVNLLECTIKNSGYYKLGAFAAMPNASIAGLIEKE